MKTRFEPIFVAITDETRMWVAADLGIKRGKIDDGALATIALVHLANELQREYMDKLGRGLKACAEALKGLVA